MRRTFGQFPHKCSFELASQFKPAMLRSEPDWHHADRRTKESSRFHPARTARTRTHPEHARDSKSFSVRESDFGDAIHCRAREKRISPTPRRQSARVNHV